MVTKTEVWKRIAEGGGYTITDEDLIASYYHDGMRWDGAGIFLEVDGEKFILEPKEAIKIPLSKFRLVRKE